MYRCYVTSVTYLVVTFSFQKFSLWLFCFFTFHRTSEQGEHFNEYRIVFFFFIYFFPFCPSSYILNFRFDESGRYFTDQGEEKLSDKSKKNGRQNHIRGNYYQLWMKTIVRSESKSSGKLWHTEKKQYAYLASANAIDFRVGKDSILPTIPNSHPI